MIIHSLCLSAILSAHEQNIHFIGDYGMSYSTRAEVRAMLKDDTLNTIFGDAFHEDASEREELAGPVIDEAIADADGEIDGYLAKRYQVPLSPVPKVTNKYSKDIAIYNLFSRLGISEDSEQKIYLTRHDAAIIAIIKNITKG